eukprot:COSAG05_NODE_499_length_9235_cov_51.826154_5_plen_104_part_00
MQRWQKALLAPLMPTALGFSAASWVPDLGAIVHEPLYRPQACRIGAVSRGTLVVQNQPIHVEGANHAAALAGRGPLSRFFVALVTTNGQTVRAVTSKTKYQGE